MRRPSNPLALAVLALLWERPMHPYEMSTTLRERRKQDSIRLNFGSLYSVVESLAKRGLIAAGDSVREGRRPARTVYTITERGTEELIDWLSDMLSVPSPQFTDFEAALSLMATLPVDDVLDLLGQRLRELRMAEHTHQAMAEAAPDSFPRLFLIESEYQSAMRRAELAFVESLVGEIESGQLGGIAMWRRLHELRTAGHSPEEIQEITREEFKEVLGWLEE